MPTEFQFFDQELAEAVQTGQKELENFQKKLDQATADTRSLEKWFQSCGYCISTYVRVDIEDYTQIGWDKYGDSWRLVAKYWEEHDECTKPIVDSNAKLRLACKPYLKMLVNEVTQTLTSIKNPSLEQDFS
jgi:hypothetical protein